MHHRGESALGVARAATVELAVGDAGFKGADRHALHRDRVEVGLENHPPRAISPGKPGDDVAPFRPDLLFAHLKPPDFEKPPNPAAKLALTRPAKGWTYAVDPDQLGKDFDDR